MPGIMKTIKIENEYYEKVRALSDASGETMIASVGSVLSAGLGELEGLGEAIVKVGRPVTEEPESEEEEQEEHSSDNSWVWVVGAVLGFAALRRVMLRPR